MTYLENAFLILIQGSGVYRSENRLIIVNKAFKGSVMRAIDFSHRKHHIGLFWWKLKNLKNFEKNPQKCHLFGHPLLRVPTSYRTNHKQRHKLTQAIVRKSSYECKIQSYDGRNGHKLSYEYDGSYDEISYDGRNSYDEPSYFYRTLLFFHWIFRENLANFDVLFCNLFCLWIEMSFERFFHSFFFNF